MSEKVILVTGASQGLGAETARILANIGANVVLNARSEEDLQNMAASISGDKSRVQVAPGDVSQAADCARIIEVAVEAFGQLDAIVNSAGILRPLTRIADSDPAAWVENVNVNLVAPFYLARYALPYIRTRRGRIINVSTGAAVRPVQGWSAYCAAKAGVNHFTRVLAEEEPQITAISFRPGRVDTAMQATLRKEGKRAMKPEQHAQFVEQYEQKELLPPEKPGRALAAAALFAPHAWSGEFMAWDDERLQSLVNSHQVA